MKLFVYGSQKRGFRSDKLLEDFKLLEIQNILKHVDKE